MWVKLENHLKVEMWIKQSSVESWEIGESRGRHPLSKSSGAAEGAQKSSAGLGEQMLEQ